MAAATFGGTRMTVLSRHEDAFTIDDSPGRGSVSRVLWVSLLAGLLVLIGALLFGHGIEHKPSGGIPWAGAGTAWALPIARFLHDAGGILTVGFLLLAVVLLPDQKGALGPAARAAHRIARWSALGWLLAVIVEALLTLSQEAGAPLGDILHWSQLRFYVTNVTEGKTALAVAIIALIILLAPAVASANSAAVLLALAIAGLVLPPLLTGHSASAGDHDAAMTSLAFHVVAASLWIGGLAAVIWLAYRRSAKSGTPTKVLSVALPRYSTLAMVCFITVGLSGILNAYIRVGSLSDLFSTRYGELVLAKATALIALGYCGYRHRKANLPAVLDGSRRAFVRLAAVEVAVMSVAVGLAVALSKSPTPVARSDENVSAAKAVLGYNLPGPISVSRLAFDWAPQLFFAVFLVVAAVWYALGIRRLRARGDSWPKLYTAAWYAGLLVVLIATQTGVNRYGEIMFSVHMAQHMLLSMVAPPLLALGAPITLALRYLPSRGSRPDARGGRAWLLAVLRSPLFRLLSNPIFTLALFVSSTFGLYFSGLFAALMASHAGHLAMSVHFLVIGCLLFWPLVSPDPLPHRPGHGARMLLLVILVPFHAFFGLAIITDTHVLAASWYERLQRPWGASLLSDQHTGGGIAMALAEPVAFLVAGVILMQWSRADARAAKAFDRKSDRDPEHDEMAAYNRYLADLAKRD
jgi:cytochrome c oxidase assembly factor CtaG/putative copper export protein